MFRRMIAFMNIATHSKKLSSPLLVVLAATAVLGIVIAIAYGIATFSRKDDSTERLTNATQRTLADLKADAISGRYGDYLAGRSASISGNHGEATKYLKSLKDVAEIDGEIAPLLMQQALLSGDVELAIDAAKRTYDGNNYHQFAALTLAVHQLKTGDVGTAKTTIKQLKPYGLYTLIYPFMHSWFNYSDSAPITSINTDKSLRHESYNALQHYHEGLQHILKKDDEKALASFKKAAEKPKTALDMTLFGVMHYYATHDKVEEAQNLYNEAAKARERAIIWNITSAEKAISDITSFQGFTAANMKEGVAQALIHLSILLYQEGAPQDALQLATLAHYLSPDNDAINFNLAHLLESDEQYDRILTLYASVNQPEFLKAASMVERARILYLSERDDDAIALLQDAAQHKGTAYHRFMILGDIARIKQEHKKAAQYYTQAIEPLELQKSDWQILYKRGIAYDMADEWDKAEADFQQALELYPDQPEVTNYLAYSWLVRGQHVEKAENLLKKAVEQRPDSAHIIDSYGWALYKQERYDEALELIERAIFLLPSDPTINDHYGDILWQLGRKNEAQYQWKRALVFEPKEQSEIDAIKEKIEHGLKDDTDS